MFIKSHVARILGSKLVSQTSPKDCLKSLESPQIGNQPPWLQTVSLLTPYGQNSYQKEQVAFVRVAVGFDFTGGEAN